MNEYFCGWYFKCQSNDKTVAVIPAYHVHGGQKSCSVQVITDEGAWNVTYAYEEFRWKKGTIEVKIGGSIFGTGGMALDIHAEGLNVTGLLKFGDLTPIRYDIMGPFRFVPFMECRHSVMSMKHTVNGRLVINGEIYLFQDGEGYIEGDRGRSFPKEYAWSQCSFSGGSLMLSVADIPMGLVHFTGCLGVVHWQGHEYRFATYLGTKVVKVAEGEIVLQQGRNILRARLLEKKSHPLLAPRGGAMTRTIRESAACRAEFSFEKKGETLFSFVTENASFEYEYEK